MWIFSSAKRTCRLCASESENTATVGIPSRLHVAITRHAISPLFAIRTLLKRGSEGLTVVSKYQSGKALFVDEFRRDSKHDVKYE